MPQLMPLLWVNSIFVSIFIMLMLMMSFFYKKDTINVMECQNYILSKNIWKW